MTDANPHDLSPRTLAMIADLHAGMAPIDVARRHGVSREWVRLVRRRAGISLPRRPPKAPTPKLPKPPTPPRPLPDRTLAILNDVQSGMLYRAVAARHGVTHHHVYRLAKQHGVSRSLSHPDWRKRRDGDGSPISNDPETVAIVRDLRAGHAYSDVAARYGTSRKRLYNTVFRSRIRRTGTPPDD